MLSDSLHFQVSLIDHKSSMSSKLYYFSGNSHMFSSGLFFAFVVFSAGRLFWTLLHLQVTAGVDMRAVSQFRVCVL